MQSVPGYTVIPSYTHPLARAAVVLPAFLAIAACSSVAGPGADDADGENEEDGHPVVIADGEGVSEGDLPEYPDRSAMLGQPCAYNVYSPPRDFWCLSVIEWIVCRPGRDRPGDRDDPDPPATYVALPIPPANQECENRDFCATRGCSVREHCREDTIDLQEIRRPDGTSCDTGRICRTGLCVPTPDTRVIHQCLSGPVEGTPCVHTARWGDEPLNGNCPCGDERISSSDCFGVPKGMRCSVCNEYTGACRQQYSDSSGDSMWGAEPEAAEAEAAELLEALEAEAAEAEGDDEGDDDAEGDKPEGSGDDDTSQ